MRPQRHDRRNNASSVHALREIPLQAACDCVDITPTALTGGAAASIDTTQAQMITAVVAETLRQLGLAGPAARSSGDGSRETTTPAFVSMRQLAAKIGNVSESTLWRWHSGATIAAQAGAHVARAGMPSLSQASISAESNSRLPPRRTPDGPSFPRKRANVGR
jgi:hypothetical protein